MSWVYRRPFDYRPSQRLGHGFRVLAYAAGAMAGTAVLGFGDAATLRGTGALAGTEAMTLTASGIPLASNPNALEGGAPLVFGQNAVLLGSGSLATAEALTLGATATGSTSNAYQPYMWAKKRRRDDIVFDYYAWDRARWTIFPYSVSTATAGIGSIAIGADGLLRGTGRLIGVAANAFSASGTVNAGGGLLGNGTVTFGVGTAALTSGASGSITAGQGFEFGASGTLTGVGNLYGPADLDIGATAAYQSLVPPSGSADMVLGATGLIRNAAEGAGIVTDMSFASTDGLQMFFSA